jgi:hypothetical protein
MTIHQTELTLDDTLIMLRSLRGRSVRVLVVTADDHRSVCSFAGTLGQTYRGDENEPDVVQHQVGGGSFAVGAEKFVGAVWSDSRILIRQGDVVTAIETE